MDYPFGQCGLYALKYCANKSSIMLLALPLFFPNYAQNYARF